MDINEVMDIISRYQSGESHHITTFRLDRYKEGATYSWVYIDILDQGEGFPQRYSCEVRTPDGKWLPFPVCSDSIDEVIAGIDWDKVDKGEHGLEEIQEKPSNTNEF